MTPELRLAARSFVLCICLSVCCFAQESPAKKNAKSSDPLAAEAAAMKEVADQEEQQQQEEDAEDFDAAVRTLEETYVVASRSGKSVFDMSVGANVVNERRLQEIQPRTAAESLRRQPGIWVQKTGHIGGAPIIRGFMGNQVIYLFDGIRRNTAGLFGGPNSFLQTVDALDINRVEVIRGPGSVLYGSDAIGGVINVITNETPKFTDEVEVHGRSFGRYASADSEYSLRQEFALSSPELYVFGGISYRDINDLYAGGDVGRQDPGGWNELNFDIEAAWAIDDNQTLSFFVQHYNRRDATRFDRAIQISEADRDLYGLRYEVQRFGFVEDLKATVYFQDQQGRSFEPTRLGDSNEETFGFDIQASSQIGDSIRITYGSQFYQDDIDSSDPLNDLADPDVTWTTFALFALTEWQVTRDFRVDLGLRWDHFNLESQAPAFSRLDPTVQMAINSGDISLSDLELDQSDDAFTGSLGFVWNFHENMAWVGHVGRSFRAPNKADQLDFGQFTFGFGVPSTGVDPESSWTVETGIHFDYPDFQGSITGFHTWVQDGIINEEGTFAGLTFIDVNQNGIEDSTEHVYVNANSEDDIVVRGIEAAGHWWLPRDWTGGWLGSHPLSVYGNITYIDGHDFGSNQPLDRGFPLNGLIGLRIDDSRNGRESRWWFEIEAQIVDSFDKIDPSRYARDSAFRRNPQSAAQGLLRSDNSVPGYSVYNFRGGYRFCDEATLTFALENFTDKKYRVKDSRIDAAGINAIVSLEVRF